MPHLEFCTEIAAPVEALWRFHDSVEVLPRILPPTTRVRLLNPPERLGPDARFTLILFQPPVFFPLAWETVFTAYEPPTRFVDEQGKGPFRSWRHEHRFEPLGPDRTRLRDAIEYEMPLGPLGRTADRLFVRRQIEGLFAYRHAATKRLLETPHPHV